MPQAVGKYLLFPFACSIQDYNFCQITFSIAWAYGEQLCYDAQFGVYYRVEKKVNGHIEGQLCCDAQFNVYYRVEKKANGHIEGQLCCDAQGSGENVGIGA